jgi:hypothetical protein
MVQRIFRAFLHAKTAKHRLKLTRDHELHRIIFIYFFCPLIHMFTLPLCPLIHMFTLPRILLPIHELDLNLMLDFS